MALAVFNGVAQNRQGALMPGASVEVRIDGVGVGPVVPLYSDRAGTTPLGNPFITPNGKFSFYASGGAYRIRVTAPTGGDYDEWRHVAVGTSAETDIEQLAVILQIGVRYADTLEDLELIEPEDNNVGGQVLNDPDPSNNGFYSWDGDEWTFGRAFPDSIVRVGNWGGTPNAQTADTEAAVNPGSPLIYFGVVETENTGPMTLNIGDGAKTVVNPIGNALVSGEWAGGVQFFLNDENEYQILASSGLGQTKADRAITIVGAGLATGGGDLSANRTITVAAANEAETLAGEISNKAVVPSHVKTLVDQAVGAEAIIRAAADDDLAEDLAGRATVEQGEKAAAISEAILVDGDADLDGGGTAVWTIANRLTGDIGVALDDEAVLRLLGLQIKDAIKVTYDDNPDFSVTWHDPQGRIAAALKNDGSLVASGIDTPEPAMYEVHFLFAEPITDPSEDLYITWLADSPDATALEYRVDGASGWMSAGSIRTRAFPELTNRWLHTAALSGLSSGTTYEFRVSGSDFSDLIKTAPLEDVTIVLASDWQTTDYTSAGGLHVMGEIATEYEPDFGIFNGDMSNADGRFTEAWALDFVEIFKKLTAEWRTVGGAQYPWIFLYGNHDGRNAAGTGNAHTGGDGTPGMLDTIASWSYYSRHPTRFARSAATVKISDEVFIIGLETDHTVPIASQFDWFAEQLDAHAGDFKHTFIAGHVPPFNNYTTRWTDTACRVMRNDFWVEAQQYSGAGKSLRAWLSGHVHKMVATPKLKMDVRPGESLTTRDNDFYRDPEGFYNIGFGQVGPPGTAASESMDRVSNIDGDPWFDAVIGPQEDEPDTYEVDGDVTNPSAPVRHIWIIETGEGEWIAMAISQENEPYFTIFEEI